MKNNNCPIEPERIKEEIKKMKSQGIENFSTIKLIGRILENYESDKLSGTFNNRGCGTLLSKERVYFGIEKSTDENGNDLKEKYGTSSSQVWKII